MLINLAAFSVAAATLANAAPQITPGQFATIPITINASRKYQQYDGMGVSEAFQRSRQVYGLAGLSSANQTRVLDLLFSNTTGAGFTLLRNGIGSSPMNNMDFMQSIEPASPGSPGATPNYLSLRQVEWDQEQVNLTIAAIARGVKSIYADAWSADGYMKTTGMLCSGVCVGFPKLTEVGFVRNRLQRRLSLWCQWDQLYHWGLAAGVCQQDRAVS